MGDKDNREKKRLNSQHIGVVNAPYRSLRWYSNKTKGEIKREKKVKVIDTVRVICNEHMRNSLPKAGRV